MNYYQLHKKQIQELDGKPSLLLHVCCGVCSVYPLLYLNQYFNITVYFANSNIYPFEEYQKRLDALRQYLKEIEANNINLIIPKYENEEFTSKISKYKDEPEGKKRCALCYYLRMKESYEYASINHFDYFTTVMSISNRKNASYINVIGEELQKKYPNVKYLYADFKKGDGITLNERMNKQLNLYHQNYCGCIYSMRKD